MLVSLNAVLFGPINKLTVDCNSVFSFCILELTFLISFYYFEGNFFLQNRHCNCLYEMEFCCLFVELTIYNEEWLDINHQLNKHLKIKHLGQSFGSNNTAFHIYIHKKMTIWFPPKVNTEKSRHQW